jgi:RNA polymerase sigma-70 factor (ECF subfamily)
MSQDFEKIFNDYSEELFAYIMRMTANTDLAEDILQDVFVRYINYAGNKTVSSPKAFLYRTAHNLTINQFRNNSKLIQPVKDDAPDIRDDSIQQRIEMDEFATRLEELIQKLDPETRSILVMKKDLGLSIEEIAGALNISERTVRRKTGRAADFIKADLKKAVFCDLFLSIIEYPGVLHRMESKMKGHYSDRQLLDVAMGISANRERERLMAHLTSCPACATRFAALQKINTPAPLARLSDCSAARIYDNALSMANSQKYTRHASKPFLRYALIASIPVAATAMIILIFGARTFYHAVPPQGLVLVENQQRHELHTGNTISVASGETKSIQTTGVEIIAYENSSLTVSRYTVSDNGFRVLGFFLEKGRIDSTFSHERPLSYSFTTPHARIDAIGTRFTLTVESAQTFVELYEGRVVVTSLADNQSTDLKPGENMAVHSTIPQTGNYQNITGQTPPHHSSPESDTIAGQASRKTESYRSLERQSQDRQRLEMREMYAEQHREMQRSEAAQRQRQEMHNNQNRERQGR